MTFGSGRKGLALDIDDNKKFTRDFGLNHIQTVHPREGHTTLSQIARSIGLTRDGVGKAFVSMIYIPKRLYRTERSKLIWSKYKAIRYLKRQSNTRLAN